MTIFFKKLVRQGLLVLLAALLAAGTASAAVTYPELRWEALIPKGWDPAKQFKSLDLSTLKDADPRAMDALQAMRNAWDNAPAEASMNGRAIRLPGFMIPLDKTGESVRTFLLVPYFGACIHSPPPPANQMVLVVVAKPVRGYQTMDTVWVNGTMEVQRSDSPWGKTAYVLKAVKVETYRR